MDYQLKLGNALVLFLNRFHCLFQLHLHLHPFLGHSQKGHFNFVLDSFIHLFGVRADILLVILLHLLHLFGTFLRTKTVFARIDNCVLVISLNMGICRIHLLH